MFVFLSWACYFFFEWEVIFLKGVVFFFLKGGYFFFLEVFLYGVFLFLSWEVLFFFIFLSHPSSSPKQQKIMTSQLTTHCSSKCQIFSLQLRNPKYSGRILISCWWALFLQCFLFLSREICHIIILVPRGKNIIFALQCGENIILILHHFC